jgi:hypothetical protein
MSTLPSQLAILLGGNPQYIEITRATPQGLHFRYASRDQQEVQCKICAKYAHSSNRIMRSSININSRSWVFRSAFCSEKGIVSKWKVVVAPQAKPRYFHPTPTNTGANKQQMRQYQDICMMA